MKRPRAQPVSTARRRFLTSAAAIALIALVVRLGHVWQMRATPYFSVLMGDSRGYSRWARELAGGNWLGSEVFYQAPLYPYFLGVIYALSGHDLLVVRVVQALAGAGACVALGYAGARLVSPGAGLIAGLMLALYPPAIFFDGLVQKSVLDVLLVCLSLAIVARLLSDRVDRRWWLLLGLALGALSQTRENALVLVAVVFVWSGTWRAAAGAARFAPAACLVAGLALVLVPVAVRNAAVGGGFYLTTSQLGSNLYIGNNPLADGSYMSLRAGRGSPEFERLDATELAERATGGSLTPSEVSSYWTGRTIAFITSQPGAWLRLVARKAYLLSNSTEIIDTESQESHAEYSWPLRVLGPIWHYGVLVPIAALGMWVLANEWRRLWPLYALTAAYAASVVLFFVVARYRLALVPFLILFAAGGLTRASAWFAQAAPARRMVAVAAVTILIVAANWPMRTAASSRAITENNLGTALQEGGRVEDAIARYRRALELDPAYAPALNNLGTALRAAGRVDEAVTVYGEALAQRDSAGGHYNLGNALMARGDHAAAAAEFRLAIAVNPRFVEAHNNLGLALEAAGRVDEAVAAFRQAIAIDDRSAVGYSNLGNALATVGEVAGAAAALQRAIDLAPDNARTRYDLGSLLLESGAFGPAAARLRESIRLSPGYAEAHNNLGIALASQGLLAEAVVEWREAVRLRPGYADALMNLERAGAKDN